MGKYDKLLRALNNTSKLTFNEVEGLLKYLGYKEGNKGKTSGSRVEFYRNGQVEKFIIHKPHPSKDVKQYVVKQLLEFLKETGDK